MNKNLLVNAIHTYYVSLTSDYTKKKMNLSESSYAIFLSVIEEYIAADYAYTDREDLAKWFKNNHWQVTERYPHEFEITHKR